VRTCLLAALLAALALAPSAHAAGPSSVVMIGEAGDYVASGVRIYEGTKHVNVSGGDAYLSVGVEGIRDQGSFSLSFGAPSGDLFAPGNYTSAQRTPFADKGHPGIDISGDGRGCNTQAGRFLLRDLTIARAKVSRLWLLFEQHCEGGDSALFGEVRIGMPVVPGALRALPTALRWPPRKVGKRGTTVPMTFTARWRLRAAAARISGSGRRAFRVTADRCRERMLSRGDTCRVYVRFTPRKTGTSRARLAVSRGGRSASVALLGDTRVPKPPR
jgi:hypothetical protein